PTSIVLDPLRQVREMAMWLLIPLVLLATIVGILAARGLTRPLAALALAARELPEHERTVQLPASGVTEIAALTDDFERMRVDLLARSNERQQATQMLSRTQHLLAKAEELAELGSWQWTVEGGQLDWSVGAYRVFGVPSSEFRGDLQWFL